MTSHAYRIAIIVAGGIVALLAVTAVTLALIVLARLDETTERLQIANRRLEAISQSQDGELDRIAASRRETIRLTCGEIERLKTGAQIPVSPVDCDARARALVPLEPNHHQPRGPSTP